jgi:predicted aldo/keto reductase-like oxidoreductase
MTRLIDGPASELEKAVREELEGSLQRMQTDYVDIFLCPYAAAGPKQVTSPALQEILEKFKKEGKIRFTGLSTHFDYANVCKAAIEGGYFDVIMLPVNFSTLLPHIRGAVLESKKAGADTAGRAGKDTGKRRRRGRARPIIDVRDVLKSAQEKNVGVVAMKGAQRGFLPPSIHDQLIGEFAKDTKLSFHQFAYRYVLDQPQVNTVAVRMGSMLHLKEALVLPQKSLKG